MLRKLKWPESVSLLTFIELGVSFILTLVSVVISVYFKSPNWATAFNALFIFVLLLMAQKILLQPVEKKPQWYEVVTNTDKFTEKFDEIKNKSKDIGMVWCAYYGDEKNLESYFTKENSLLINQGKHLFRLINTERIAGWKPDLASQVKDGEKLYDEHLKWMKGSSSSDHYGCLKTYINEYEVAIGKIYDESKGCDILRGCIVINDGYRPKFMVYLDTSKEEGEKAEKLLDGLFNWFRREKETVENRAKVTTQAGNPPETKPTN